MTEKLISHTDLDRLLARLGERGTVYAPGRDEAGDVDLIEWWQNEPITLGFKNFRQSPKGFFLPQNQTLLHLEDGHRRSRFCPIERHSSSESGRAMPGR